MCLIMILCIVFSLVRRWILSINTFSILAYNTYRLDEIKPILLHKTAMGSDTSYDNIISYSPYTENDDYIRTQ